MSVILLILSNEMITVTKDFQHRLYSCFLILGHFIGWLFIQSRHDANLAINFEFAVCWPNFNGCQNLLEAIAPIIPIWVSTASFLTLLLALFVWHQSVDNKGRRILVFVAFLIHVSFLALDYRMKMNQHLMHFAIDLVFIFVREPQSIIRLLLVFIYFWAGLLKFHPDWTSGLALYEQPLFIPQRYNQLACYYVLVLELVVVWFLLAKKRWIRNLALFQFFLFHVSSFPVVGFYYPILMFLLISLFVIYEREFSLNGFKLSKAHIAIVLVFSFLQVLPRLLSNEPAMTAQSRTTSLHMFDALIVCEWKMTKPDGAEVFFKSSGTPRLRCDPIVFFSSVRNYCNYRVQDRSIVIQARLLSRRSSEKQFHEIVNLHDACAETQEPVSMFYNAWVKDPVR